VPAPQAGIYRAAILSEDVERNANVYTGVSPDDNDCG
jgi:hypothetical protein